MCEKCKNESDGDYEGDTIEEQRQKAVESVVERHEALGLDIEDIQLRFTPKYKWPCVRVNMNTDTPKYEIHQRSAQGPISTGRPPLSAIAQVAYIETDNTYQEACDILGLDADTPYKALFMCEVPPINPVRVNSHEDRQQFDSKITEMHAEEG